MKDSVTRPADVKRGRLPRKTSGNPYGALAQLVARDIRIVEVRGSTPLCSTTAEALILNASAFFVFGQGQICYILGFLIWFYALIYKAWRHFLFCYIVRQNFSYFVRQFYDFIFLRMRISIH